MEDNRAGFWPIYAWAAILFVCCMVCHGELALQKPNPKQLTLFFLMVSVGGAIGGSFVAIVAPLAFDSYWELPIGLTVCAEAWPAWIFTGLRKRFRKARVSPQDSVAALR